MPQHHYPTGSNYNQGMARKLRDHIGNQTSSTHLPLDKMAAILADNILKCIFLNENVWISIKISLKFIP